MREAKAHRLWYCSGPRGFKLNFTCVFFFHVPTLEIFRVSFCSTTANRRKKEKKKKRPSRNVLQATERELYNDVLEKGLCHIRSEWVCGEDGEHTTRPTDACVTVCYIQCKLYLKHVHGWGMWCLDWLLLRYWQVCSVKRAARYLKYTFNIQYTQKCIYSERMTGQWGFHRWGLNALFTAASLAYY